MRGMRTRIRWPSIPFLAAVLLLLPFVLIILIVLEGKLFGTAYLGRACNAIGIEDELGELYTRFMRLFLR